MSNKKNVIFGPWCGEFSYELCWWCPQLRVARKEHFSDSHVIAFSFPGRYGLYRDFVDQFVGYDNVTLDNIGAPDCGISVKKDKYSCKYREGDPASDKFMNEWLTSHNILVNQQVNSANIPNCGRRHYKLIGGSGTMCDNPYGDYQHLDARPHIHKRIQEKLHGFFTPEKKLIAIMARTRKRLDREDGENWNPKHWETFIHHLIDDLDLGIVLIGIPPDPDRGVSGALTFDNIPGKLCSMLSTGDDAVEEQIAILKNTACSFYGSSGASHLTFFTNTPSFIFSQKQDGFRLNYNWCHKLTDHHKNVKVYYSTNPGKDLWNMSPDVIFQEFKQFYEHIKV